MFACSILCESFKAILSIHINFPMTLKYFKRGELYQSNCVDIDSLNSFGLDIFTSFIMVSCLWIDLLLFVTVVN